MEERGGGNEKKGMAVASSRLVSPVLGATRRLPRQIPFELQSFSFFLLRLHHEPCQRWLLGNDDTYGTVRSSFPLSLSFSLSLSLSLSFFLSFIFSLFAFQLSCFFSFCFFLCLSFLHSCHFARVCLFGFSHFRGCKQRNNRL